MKSTQTLYLIIIIGLFFSSCSTSDNAVSGSFIQKRKYNKGFFVDLRNHKQKLDEKAEVVAADASKEQAIAETEPVLNASANINTSDDNSTNENALGVITYQASDLSAVAYAKTTNNRGLSNSTAKKLESYRTVEIPSPLHFAIVKSKSPEKTDSDKGKSQIIAAVLCFFVGIIGIHRFYLGYTTIGIIQIITLGGCGLWTLIDFIRILMGDLKPANEDYTETF